MFFLPLSILVIFLFILALPILLVLGYFQIVTIGFENLGFSSEATLLIFLLMIVGSVINIPLGRTKYEYVERRVLGFFKKTEMEASGIAINLGGAVIPVLISLYFLTKVPLEPVLIATLFMIVSLKFLARVVPGRGIRIPFLLPPFLAVLFALIFAPEFAAPCAFISGVLGTIIGADILNLPKAKRMGSGFISIGGAGVFDGIFLVGIVSALFI